MKAALLVFLAAALVACAGTVRGTVEFDTRTAAEAV